MNATLIVSYVLIAAVAFVGALYANRDVLLASEDDRVGAAFCSLGLFILAALWPMTAVICLAAAVFWVIAQAIVRVMP